MTIKEAWEIVQHPMSPSNFKGDKLLEATKMVDEALTELERLRKFKATFDAYELSQKQGFIAYENWQECEKEIKELQKMETYQEQALSLNHKQAIEVIDILTEHGALLGLPIDIRIDYLKAHNKAKEWIKKIRSDEK